jgi:hypothetical protein
VFAIALTSIWTPGAKRPFYESRHYIICKRSKQPWNPNILRFFAELTGYLVEGLRLFPSKTPDRKMPGRTDQIAVRMKRATPPFHSAA